MALIKCPECKRQVSDKASACPHCGHPIIKKVYDDFSGSHRTLEKIVWVVLDGCAGLYGRLRSITAFQKKRGMLLAIGLVILLFLYAIQILVRTQEINREAQFIQEQQSKALAQKEAEDSRYRIEQEEYAKLTLKEHIEAAKKALSRGDLKAATAHLLPMPTDSKEWEEEGQRLMNRIRSIQYKDQLGPQRGGLLGFTWRRGGFDSVAIIESITIGNSRATACRDIHGIMSFVAKSGSVLGSQKFTIYDVVPPNKTRTFRNIRVGFLPDQTESVGVTILNCD